MGSIQDPWDETLHLREARAHTKRALLLSLYKMINNLVTFWTGRAIQDSLVLILFLECKNKNKSSQRSLKENLSFNLELLSFFLEF